MTFTLITSLTFCSFLWDFFTFLSTYISSSISSSISTSFYCHTKPGMIVTLSAIMPSTDIPNVWITSKIFKAGFIIGTTMFSVLVDLISIRSNP